MGEQTQIDLLTVTPSLSPRLKRMAELSGAVERAKAKFNILTHHDPGSEAPWLGVQALPGETRDIGQLMAEECRLLDESGRTTYGVTEADVVLDMALFSGVNPKTSQEFQDLLEFRELERAR